VQQKYGTEEQLTGFDLDNIFGTFVIVDVVSTMG